MSKFNAGQKTTHTLTHEKHVHKYPNENHSHHKDPEKTKMAREGNFGTKEQLHAKLDQVQEKFPGVHITHRHNSTVR